MVNREVMYEYKQKIEEMIEVEMSKPIIPVTLENVHKMLEILRYVKILHKK